MSCIGIDHVQVAAPSGCEPAARQFYGELLGLAEVPKPAELARRGGLWFALGAQQLHIGVEAEFRPAKKAHPAILVRDPDVLAVLAARLAAAGVAITRDPAEVVGVVRFFAHDPWGNRLEFVAPA